MTTPLDKTDLLPGVIGRQQETIHLLVVLAIEVLHIVDHRHGMYLPVEETIAHPLDEHPLPDERGMILQDDQDVIVHLHAGGQMIQIQKTAGVEVQVLTVEIRNEIVIGDSIPQFIVNKVNVIFLLIYFTSFPNSN